MLIFLFCLDRDEPRASPRFDAVADGVLDQRLKHESWNQGFHEFIRNALFQSKPFAKTLLLNADICPNEFELLRQGNLLFLHRINRAARSARNRPNAPGGSGLSVFEAGDRPGASERCGRGKIRATARKLARLVPTTRRQANK